MWPLFTYKGSFTIAFHLRESSGWSMPTLQQTSKKQSKTGRKETLQRNKIVTDHIPTTYTVYTLLTTCKTLSETDYVHRINVNVNIILLYGILQITVLFDMCTAFALGHSIIFKFDMGADGRSKGKGTGGSCHPHSLRPLWRRPYLDDSTTCIQTRSYSYTHHETVISKDHGFSNSTILFKQCTQRLFRCPVTNVGNVYLDRRKPVGEKKHRLKPFKK